MLKKILKLSFLIFSYVTAKIFFIKSGPAILMYHSFDKSGWKYGVSPDKLEQQLKYLVKSKNILSLHDVVTFVKGENNLPNNSVAITIDDGYEDTFSVFFPFAKKYNIPFTIFLTTDLSRRPNLGNLTRPTLEHLKEMHASGLVTFGLHGHSHIHFPEVFKSDLIQQEIIESENFLQEITGEKPKFVAYPSGRYDNNVTSYFSSDSRYLAGLAIHSGFVNRGDNLFALRRVEVSRNIESLIFFKLRLTTALVVYNSFVSKYKKFLC